MVFLVLKTTSKFCFLKSFLIWVTCSATYADVVHFFLALMSIFCNTTADWNTGTFCVTLELTGTFSATLVLAGTFSVTLDLTGKFSVMLELIGTLIFSVTLELTGTLSVKLVVAGTFSVILQLCGTLEHIL